MSQSLTVLGKPAARITAPTGGVRKFVADKYGVTLPPFVKGVKGPTFKEVKALCVLNGATEAQLKLDGKEWDAVRDAHYVSSAIFIGAIAADPSWRKSVRESVNKSGEVIGYAATMRREHGANKGIVAQLTAQVAELTRRLASPTALPVA